MSGSLLFALACALVAIVYGGLSSLWILRKPTGNQRVRDIAAAIQEGASAYLNRQYTTIGVVGGVLFLLIGFGLDSWVTASGLPIRKWLNTSGQSYRALGKARVDAATDAEIASWLSADGKLVKRPVLVSGDRVLVGFKAEAYEALVSNR